MNRFGNNGLTLIEIAVVLAILGILITALGISLTGWQARYRIESQIKEIYVDLMNARVQAMQRNRVYFVDLSPTQYSIYEDTNPAPDGNNILETGVDRRVTQKKTNYPLNAVLALGATRFQFNKDGFASLNGTVRLVSSETPDYDCVVIFSTRINMGKWDGANCVAK